jgi:hypothetical protein
MDCRSLFRVLQTKHVLTDADYPLGRDGGVAWWETPPRALGAVVSAFTWAGPYVGVTEWISQLRRPCWRISRIPRPFQRSEQRLCRGGVLGFNLQAGSLVYGIEADLSWLSNKSAYIDPNGAVNNFYPSETNRLNDLGTVRGRHLGRGLGPR